MWRKKSQWWKKLKRNLLLSRSVIVVCRCWWFLKGFFASYLIFFLLVAIAYPILYSMFVLFWCDYLVRLWWISMEMKVFIEIYFHLWKFMVLINEELSRIIKFLNFEFLSPYFLFLRIFEYFITLYQKM